MKRLRVLLVCLIVALLCCQDVHCSEQSSSGSGHSARDEDPDSYEQEQDSTQNKVVEDQTTHTSNDLGLESERAAREKLASIHHEQTVNQLEVETKETKQSRELDIIPVLHEPELPTEPQAHLGLQTDTQDHDHDKESPVLTTPEPLSELVHESANAVVQAASSSEDHDAQPSLDSDPSVPLDEAENVPTSESAGPTDTSAVWVASAGDELPVDSYLFAEHSDSQCRLITPELATCENSPFGRPLLSVDEAGTDDPLSSQSQSSDFEADSRQSSPELSEPGAAERVGQKEEEQLEDVLSSLEQEGNASHLHHKQQMGDANVAREADHSVPSKDDIPTFDEWKKQVMEVEKEKSQTLHTSTSGNPHSAKKVQKNFKNNYASVECGAKILSANSEAKSTSAILMENMDLYMLNPCSTKIWFVIELCEPIQVKQLDIANFELFSSTPRDFLVSISDRYPTNKWVKLGTFHARDERIVQSFPLDEQLYAKYVKMFIKYIKVELLSHFGAEHFCPLSLIRVFGTSMVEEYEEIADSQYPSERLEYLDEDYDYPPGYQPSEEKASKNLLGSATNAILNMVNNIAANVLGGKSELQDGAEIGGNSTEEGGEIKESTDVKVDSPEASLDSAGLDPAKPEQTATEKLSNTSSDSTSSSSLSDSSEDRQIVTLVEEDEDEEPKQSTVTLLEEEVEEEEDKCEEKMRRYANRNQWESQTYCPFSSLSSLSLSCMATLPELLHRWCSARVAKERLQSLRRRQLNTETQTDENISVQRLPVIPVPTPTQEVFPLTEKAPESEALGEIHNQGKPLGEVQTDLQVNAQPSDIHTPELNILLEPSRTATIPPHTSSAPHSTMMRPTLTHEEKLLPPVKDEALDPVPTPPLQAVSIPETQPVGSATLTLSVSPPLLVLPLETASSVSSLTPVKEQPVVSLPTASRPENLLPPPTELPAAVPPADSHTDSVKSGTDNGGSKQKQNTDDPQIQGEQGNNLSQTGHPHRTEDFVEEDLLNTNIQRTATDFYAELQNGGDYSGGTLNGGAVHGSSQKESVFMRLNNRIKALEMNMSLSSRYLEELSQRYRKQMEEMQKGFNKTIIKLQNTSRIAQEQDQKQTDSIQVLQSQLEDVTKLMLNLTATVSQLQREVSDRQSYLVLSLVLCLLLGVLLCLQCCCSSSPSPKANFTPLPKSNHYPSPKRCFSSYDDMSLKRRVTSPLVRSKSFQLSSTEGPDDLFIVEPLRFSPEKKKKRGKTKSLDKVETLKPFDPSLPLTNGDLKCNGFHSSLPAMPPPPPPPPLPPPPVWHPLPSTDQVASLPTLTSKEFPSETSSCSSSTQSEESYTNRLSPPSPVCPSASMCNGHGVYAPLTQSSTMSRQEKRSMKRQRSRQSELQFPLVPGGGVDSLPSLQQLMKGNKDMSVGTIRATAVTGHV
ncbi:SUN domain-containing ossification factor isoform X2 [Girardinichthys multiradiatus]|uniref:SUN domain-containing ossification factor isoform X2 n=1 Tax=Girardinichthys multiradiatus TaxID=208333 RepID=UPI001FAC8D93|nr:SUN domain-containing ossification factor isoform X2 [Girardinichthys multiradiatus]